MNNFFDYDYKKDEMDKINNDIELQNKALENIIANQQKEENQIREDYDSLGSSAGRFLQVFGAGLRGENASAVAQAQREDLNKRLQNAQSRYKDQRDSAYNQYKDLLARREALEKSKYDRERDQVKDSQFEKEFGLKDRQIANQEKVTNAEIEALQNKTKQAAINEQIQVEEKQKAAKDILDKINNMKANGTVDAKTYFGNIMRTDNGKKSDAEKENINLAIIEYNTGLTGKDALDYLKKNESAFPTPYDNDDVTFQKWSNLGFDSTVMSPKEVEIQKNIDKRANEYIKKINKFTGDPEKTIKLLEKYDDDPEKAYEAVLGNPSIVKPYR